jgi:hypothetical protein
MLSRTGAPVPIGKNRFLTTGALAVGFCVLGISNGVGWFAKNSQAGASYILEYETLDYGVAFGVSLLLFLTYGRVERRLGGWRLAAVVSALCYGAGMSWRVLADLGIWWLGLSRTLNLDAGVLFIRGGLMNGTTLGLVSLLYFAIEHWRRAAEEKERASAAAAIAQQAQLQMLRYQLNPHFLFNALNMIRGLIVEDPGRSREMLTELSDFLRYSLDGNGGDGAIGDEIRAIESFMAIQRIRFEEQLDATVRVDDSALDVAVPCFLIHPMVENAVKYGMRTSAMPLRIRIDVTRQDDEITIRVANTGRLLAQQSADGADGLPESTGIGLKNVAERLKLAFPGRHSFTIRQSEGWVHAEVALRLTAGGR